MSLGLALNAAVSGLDVTQQSLAVLSNNISNANTEGYSRQTVQQSALIVAGRGGGAGVEQIKRVIDTFFQESSRIQSSTVNKSGIVDEYYRRLQIFFGQPNQGNSLDSSVNNFFASLNSLATSPDQTFFKTDAVTKGIALTNKISGLAYDVEKTRFDIDQEIKRSIDEVNTAIADLFSANTAIQQAGALGQNKSGLFDRRDIALEKISKNLDVNVTYSSDGRAFVGTPSGIELLGNTQYVLSYAPAGSVDNFINDDQMAAINALIKRSDGTIQQDPKQEIVSGGLPGSITSKIREGKLKGLLDLRDDLLPKVVEQLDELATVMRNQINAIHNDGSAYPPLNTLKGTKVITSNEVRAWGGSVRIGVNGQDGKPPLSPYSDETYLRPLQLRLSELDSGTGFGKADTQTIVNEINYYYGAQQKRVRLGNLYDIKLAARSDTAATGSPFTFDFELDNDSANTANVQVTAVTVSGGSTIASGVPLTYNLAAGERRRTAPAGSEITANLAGAGPWTVNATVQVTDSVTGQVSTDTITWQIAAAATGLRNQRYVTTNTSFVGNAGIVNPSSIAAIASASIVDAAGSLVASGNPGFLKLNAQKSNFGISIDEMNSVESGIPNSSASKQAATATSRGFSHYFGLNDFFVTNNDKNQNSAYNLKIRDDIAKTPGFISTGELILSKQPADPTAKPVYTYELGKGGNQTIKRLADLQNNRVSFNSTSTLPKMTLSIAGYGAEILGYLTSKTQNATASAAQDKLIGDGLNQRLESSRGVNLDEEVAHITELQNAYKASSTVINVVKDLFDSLLQVF